jgi:hypothetical protein
VKIQYMLGDKGMNTVVSHVDEVKAAVEAEARAIGARAEGNLAAHKHDGHAYIEVEAGDKGVDWFITLRDEAALSIEFGHFFDNGEIEAQVTYVPGLYVLSRAAGLV